jgi:polysaccharide export outer membrane protein
MLTRLRKQVFTSPRRGSVLGGMALAVLFAACSSSPPPSTALADGAEPDLGLRPGDAVHVQVWREEDLSGEFTVDDRGVVTLPLLGDRQVAGLDPAELRDNLLADYREYLQNPAIQVTVLRRINILGAVTQPGLYPVDATISLSEALGMAGGITPTGDEDDIRVIRDGRVIHRALDQATMVGAVDIRSGDQVMVGEKGWFARNPGALLGSLLGASAVIITALLR